MNGYECLREELIKRGCTKAQAESKVVPVVVEILSGGDSTFSDVEKLTKERDDLESFIRTMAKVKWSLEEEIKRLKNENEKQKNAQERNYQEYKKLIDAECERIKDELSGFETAEGRDAYRTAQAFINTVNVETKYDNTAFIIGLAAILANGKIGAIEELRKINPRIPHMETMMKQMPWDKGN